MFPEIKSFTKEFKPRENIFPLIQTQKSNLFSRLSLNTLGLEIENSLIKLDLDSRNNNMEEYDDRWDPLKCSAPSLRGHIVNEHFSPRILTVFGVARFDIELAYYRGFSLGWVVKKAYQRLEEDPIQATLRFGSRLGDGWPTMERYLKYQDLQGYREMIVRNLMYIEAMGLAPFKRN